MVEADQEDKQAPYLTPSVTSHVSEHSVGIQNILRGILDEIRLKKDSKLPYITLSYAQSIDGSIAANHDDRLILSGKNSMKMTHSLRALHSAIMVGIGTVIADDPQLNVRLVNGFDQQPKPLIIDPELKTPTSSKIISRNPIIVCSSLGLDNIIYESCEHMHLYDNSHDKSHDKSHQVVIIPNSSDHTLCSSHQQPSSQDNSHDNSHDKSHDKSHDNSHDSCVTTIYRSHRPLLHQLNSDRSLSVKSQRFFSLISCGATILVCRPLDEYADINLTHLFQYLRQYEDISSIMVEGGAYIINELLSQYTICIDKLVITISAQFVGGLRSYSPYPPYRNQPAIIRLNNTSWIQVDNDMILVADTCRC